MDIRQLIAIGVTKWEEGFIDYPANPRNSFSYKIQFLDFTYSNSRKYLTANFQVLRYVLQNNEPVLDINYINSSVANNETYVDFFGNVVPQFIEGENGEQIPNPEAWDTEFARMQYIFNAPLKDSDVVVSYQQKLFDEGFFDFPKNRSL